LALAVVIAQQIVPGVDGVMRSPATGIMIATGAVRVLVRKGEDHQFRSQISVSRAEGVMTMAQSLADLVRTGRITRETALAHCFRTDDFERYLG
jgi:twitching motility protein PilT